jgi:hypothetical protein
MSGPTTEAGAALHHELHVGCAGLGGWCPLGDRIAAIEREAAASAPAAPLDPLLIAARDVLDQAEADDDFDGQFIDYLVPHDAIASLRAAYEPWSAPTATTAEEQA